VSAAAYAEWVSRGHTHQAARRPLDALQCYRRALRESPRGSEARFHIGEALWQLGRLDEAVGAWREVVAGDERFLPAWQALAEASLGLGDAATAREAARHVLQALPSDGHATAVLAIAALRDPEQADESGSAALQALLSQDSAWLAVPGLGGALAVALEQVRDADLTGRVVAAATGMAGEVHPRLHALICEYLASTGALDDAPFAAMAARPLGVDDHDLLRRVARAAALARLPSAQALATAYAQACAHVFRAAVPLLWPRRSAGARPRIIIVAGDGAGRDRAAALSQALATHADVTPAIVGEQIAGTLDDARRLAGLDADLLIDLAGLDAPIGPLLAQRPARRIVTHAGVAGPIPPPLVDACADSDAALMAMLPSLAVADTGSPPVDVLDAAWREAVAAHQAGERALAASRYARILAWQPGHAQALYLQAVLSREMCDLDAARTGFMAALAIAPGYEEARSAAVSAAAAAGDAEAAATLMADVAASASPALLRACGLACLALHEAGAAAPFFEAALAREPSDAETHYNLGVALQMQRRHADAARSYQRALVCNPSLIAADFNLGVLFTELGNRDGALAAFGQVLAHDPRHVAAHKNLCEVLLGAGRIDAWLAQFRRFEQQCPAALALAVQALEACHYAGDFAGVERYLEGLRQERFGAANETELADALEQLLYLLLYFDVEPQMLHRFARTYDETATHVYGAPLPRRSRRKPGKLRIGYLSADLRDHVMGKMIYQAIRHHDRSRFEVHLYALSEVRDAWTVRFEACTDALTPLAGLDDRAAVERIAADDLDILVDLNTHTKGARPAILARKPARVQITHIASAGTTGLAAIDFKLTDRYADVPENQEDQLEPLLAMSGCVYPYRHIEPAQGRPHRREALGLAGDAVVIGAFVNPLKLSRRCLTLWREVLERLPRARLAFSPLDPGLRESYRRIVTAAGIPAERLVFVPASADEAVNQARYALVDLVLDPMPFGGVNGTLEALDAGVPVVTLLGKRHGERTSYSILANLGVTATVASTGRDYVALAVRLAEDEAFARQVRHDIRAGLARSPLTDMVAHARNLEAAYVEALARCAADVLDATPRVAALE
jgi:predicted O-linked N-acetylglucosamine transferase (SPINDLY family)